MKYLSKHFLLVAFLTLGASVHAQQWVTEARLYGVTLSCKANSGQIVPLLLSERAVKLGGGAYAHFDSTRGPSIMFSQAYLQTLPRLGVFFVFYHECAHVALPIGIGLGTTAQEVNADCYAVREMRNAGLLTSWQDFNEAISVVKNMAGSAMGHLPGPERVKAAAECLNIPILRSASSICRSMDMIFAGGKALLSRPSLDNKTIFEGSYCYVDKQRPWLNCSRDFDNENAAIAFQNTFMNAMESCLPKDFIYSKVHVFQDWTNAATGQRVSMKRELDDRRVEFGVMPEK
jgi:hypothetical protein